MSALQLSLRTHTRPPSGGAGRWRGWGPRGRVAPQLRSARQPAGQTKGLPAKGGVISPPARRPGVRTSNARFPTFGRFFFFPLTPKQMRLQRGLLAPDPGAVGCFARMRAAHSGGPGRGNLVGEEGGETSGRVTGVGMWLRGWMEVLTQRHRAGSVVRMRPGPTIPSVFLSSHSPPRTRKTPFPSL